MRFLGIDLGWQSGGSGLCCLALDGDNHLQLIALTHAHDRAQVLDWIQQYAPPSQPALVAVDAPTLIPNPSGMRLCDRLAHRYFGKYDAGCYPANQSRPFAPALIEFGLALEAQGFRHAPNLMPQQPGRYQIELFPHPATVHLFRLNRILKYKKGRLGDRRPELEKLRQLHLSVLPTLTPSLSLHPEEVPTIPTQGKPMKQVEDQLDSLTCAYAGAHWWWWGKAKNWVLGSAIEGYIIVPAPYDDQQYPA